MQRLSRRKKSPPPTRGRAPARWTWLEVLLVCMSVAMIAFPLYASTLTIVRPPIAPAQGLNAQDATTEPGATDAPPADTDVPAPPADTDVPKPVDTDVPQADVPAATNTEAAPADTAVPAQVVDTQVPQPTNTQDPGIGDPNQRVTRTPEQITATPGGAAPTDTSGPAGPTSTTDPNRPTSGAATPTDTTAPGAPSDTPVTTDTSGPESPTVTPFAPPAPPPLEIIKFASVTAATPGQQFSYSLSVRTTSDTAITVAVRDVVNSQLQVLSVSQTTGSCSSGQTVNCTVTVQNGSPASITIQVRANSTAQGNVSNQASASSSGTTAASDIVNVTISGSGVPTSTFTPGGVTNTPTTNNPGNPPSSTPVNAASSTPGTGASVTPTNTKTSSGGVGGGGGGGGGGSSSGGNKKNDKATETPPPPPPPPEQQTAVPPAAPAGPGATARPVVRRSPTRVVARITPVPAVVSPVAAAATSSSTPVASQPSPTSAGPPVGDTNVFFRIASDWGSASPGQEVRYTLVLRNTRPANANVNNDLRDVTIRTTLPNNLDVTGAVASRNDPTRAGNDVTLGLDAVRPGETVALTITTKIKQDVAIGTLIVAQGQTTYAALGQPLFSNVVTLLVVGTAPAAITVTSDSRFQAQATSTVAATTDTSSAYPAPSSAATTAATTAASVTSVPTAATAAASATAAPAATVTRIPAGGMTAPGGTAPLPDTSTGVPLLGFGLLGLTMLVRTLRLHRSRERI